MSKIADYFNEIQITALAYPSVVSVEKIRETEDQKENIGIYRYRIYMKNGDLLEMTARVKIEAGECVVTKYRHHWQDKCGKIKKRWDNAPHHPELDNFPYHIHDGSEENVKSHPPVNAMMVLRLVLYSPELTCNLVDYGSEK